MAKTRDSDKLFIVRKFVKAKDALEALKKEKKQAPDEVYLDGDWKKDSLPSAIGFNFSPGNQEDDSE